MPGILNLKFKGNKSFVAFSNLNDTESLTKTWKVCTKVASYLEQGQRLENLSWRLWHLQNLMVDTDNAKSKREFKKLSKCMGDKLDKEKGRPLTSLPAPHFTRTPSTDLLRARAAEKERTRDAGAQGPEHIIQRMQFTFAVEAPPAAAGTTTTNNNNTGGTATTTPGAGNANANAGNTNTTTTAGPTGATKRKRAQHDEHGDAPGGENDDGNGNGSGRSVRLPSVFSTSFGPEALLSVSVRPAPSLAPRRGYGEGWSHYGAHTHTHSQAAAGDADAGAQVQSAGGGGAGPNAGGGAEGRGRSADMRVARPTIELPLDELLNAEMEEEEHEHEHDAGMFGLHHSSNEESDSASASGSGSGRDEDVAARMGAWSSLGMGTGMEMGAGWDEIMRGAQAGFGPFYNDPTTTATGAPANTGYEPLTLDPHAAFGFHHKRANNEKANSTATPTLSPNAYFLQELDEHQHAMELDQHRGHASVSTPTSASHTSASASSSPVHHTSSAAPNYPTPPAASTPTSAANATKGRYAAARRYEVDAEDEEDEDDVFDAESSDDGGDDSADSDFFEMSAGRRSRRARASHSTANNNSHSASHNSKKGGGGARRRAAGAGASATVSGGGGAGAGGGGGGASVSVGGATKRPVLSVRVPVRGQSGQGMRPPADVPMHASASAPAGGAGGASAGAGGGAGALLNSAPGGVKAECSNCGATHTPLWRRGLNDELNCNACGLYCKLHKRPRPKTMRNTGGGGEGRGQSVRAEAVDVMAQCYNCHTTATPLWRKDDEGKTVCNACGLYYKLHGSARPISMKSDVIRKRSRHDARRGGASASVSETPTASPGVSRRASPAPAGPASSASTSAGRASPTLAPDSTTTHSYDAPSELSTALGPKPAYGHPYPYHEQYPDALPFASVDVGSELESGNGGAQQQQQQRANKRRRMSVDSASEPPSSAVSYGSYADGYTSASSQFSMEFPFSRFPNVGYNENGGAQGGGGDNGSRGGGLRGGGGANAFWHPPMMVQGENSNSSPGGFHPPMLPTAEEAPMDYLHPPMVLHNNYHQDEESLNNWFMQGSGLHPPMLPGDEGQMMGMMGGAHPPMMIEDFYDSNGNMHY